MKRLSILSFVAVLITLGPTAANSSAPKPAAHPAKAVRHASRTRRHAFHPPLKRPDLAISVEGRDVAYAGAAFDMGQATPTRLSAARILGAPVAGSLGLQRGDAPILDAHEVNQAAAVQMERSNASVGARVNLNF